MPTWLKDAVFYEIYPQSFYDSNGDGIGDIPGIIQKLDHIQNLGCNALWLNPVYDSPFWDAGYDVRNYKEVAPRYGTNEDLYDLFRAAHERGIRVLLDLVPGHTSIDHPWFLEAKKTEKNPCSGRYIFTRSVWDMPPGYRWISGFTERDGSFLVNFFCTQPALNYGFHEITDPRWQNPTDHPDCRATLELLKDIMRFWLDKGADGFRVDMADSLVKNDENKIATAKLWRSVREMLDSDYPEAAMVSEWSNPEQSVNMGGFHMDFYLDHKHNGYHSLVRLREDGVNRCYVGKGAPGDITRFTADFVPKYECVKGNGYISFITCNHDSPRLTRFLGIDEVKLAYALLFTMPGVPFLYYGDEIGMRYIEGLPSKEGGYDRTGSRTPMQWGAGKNLGFSDSDPEALYLPVDSGAAAPTVQAQRSDPDSILNIVKELISLRRRFEDLNADGDFEVVHAKSGDPLFVYRRGSLHLFVNPGATEAWIEWPGAAEAGVGRPGEVGSAVGQPGEAEGAESGITRPGQEQRSDAIFSIGRARKENGKIILSPQSFAIFA